MPTKGKNGPPKQGPKAKTVKSGLSPSASAPPEDGARAAAAGKPPTEASPKKGK